MIAELPDSMTLDGVLDRQKKQQAEDAELGQDDFLRMLVAQLENQDPLNPQDGTEFTAQLATFSSLEQQIAMREGIERLLESESGGDAVARQLEAAGLIGREVEARGAQVAVDGSGAVPLAFDLEGAATSGRIDVLTPDGRRVAALDVPGSALSAGRNRVLWDGTDGFGGALPAGVYRFEVSAVSGGEAVAAEPRMAGRVTAASFDDGGAVLRLGDRVVRLEDVLEVRETGP